MPRLPERFSSRLLEAGSHALDLGDRENPLVDVVNARLNDLKTDPLHAGPREKIELVVSRNRVNGQLIVMLSGHLNALAILKVDDPKRVALEQHAVRSACRSFFASDARNV